MQQQPIPSFAIFDDYRPTVAITVVIRWLLLSTWLVMVNYRVDHDATWIVYNAMGAVLASANAYVSWRVVAGRSITWPHALSLSLLDVVVITAGLFVFNGFQNRFFVFYYPALLGFSLMFPRRASFSLLGAVIALYVYLSLTVEPTIDLDLFQEKVLAVRMVTIIGIVAAGGMLASWERARRREAVAAERLRSTENLELQRTAQKAELAALEERGRIAREIHDGVAQSIYMLSLQLETCAELAANDPNGHRDTKANGLRGRLDQLVSLSKESLLEVRHYIFDLKPYLAGEKGLGEMVESLAREFRNVAGVAVNVDVSGEEHQVSTSLSTCVYRVIQEALANVFKHAQATEVTVSLSVDASGVTVTVRDNGGGFDPKTAVAGHGLDNMRQRAEELGGSFVLDSTAGQGTNVSINLPSQVHA